MRTPFVEEFKLNTLVVALVALSVASSAQDLVTTQRALRYLVGDPLLWAWPEKVTPGECSGTLLSW
jgi:hypothetical protein